jgi:D-tagatose-1,6-bisphosphate aldolase subunit GatZ/KbaZ
MPCGGDAGQALDPEVIAARAAELCQAAEQAWEQLPEGSPSPLYVIGTEVPIPGGEQLEAGGPQVTRVEDAQATVEAHRVSFAKLGLEPAIERVIGLVVHPGVEFGSSEISHYDRAHTRSIREHLPERPELVYEAHSTDYQTGRALREMVEDHFAILKVGPWLTFAMREAIFALDAVERESLAGRRGVTLAEVPRTVEEAMLGNPAHWRDYYSGDESALRYARKYSYSDRSRYYWPDAGVQASVERLVGNLTEWPAPMPLLSQFLPAQYAAVQAGELPNEPAALIRDRIGEVLRLYSAACGTRIGATGGV